MLDELVSQLGKENVLTDEASRVFYAQDVYTRDLPAEAVVRPRTAADLASAVATITAAGHAVIARGGGMSYTSGIVPREAGTVIVDTQAMDQIVEVNTEDMYVTVQAGCTWKTLHDALDGTGFRTPYWGTLSGLHATVGGGVSQNSIFWGSGRHGTVADSVIGLEVVLADGTLVRTGAAAAENRAPFFRHYGPDLTGLFCCDNGALGLKASVTLKLVPACEHREGLAFDFAEPEGLIAAMSEIARQQLADECFAFDPRLQAVRMQRESLMSDMKKLAGVLKSGKGLFGSLKDGAKVALAGRGFMKDVDYSLNVMLERRSAAAASEDAEAVRSICIEYGAREIENSIPKILRANPFTPLNNMVGPNGERWTPVHAIVPHSKAQQTFTDIEAVFAANEALMEEHGIGWGYLLTVIGTGGFVIEPVFFTPHSLNELHEATVEKSVLNKMPGFDPNPAAMEATAQIRQAVIDAFQNAGGVHMQIGKSYPYRESLHPASWRIVESIKDAVDPKRRVNPGSLGLE